MSLLVLSWLAGLGAQTAHAEAAASLVPVGSDSLGARGLNAALAIADHCAFVGSRGSGAVEIVNISDPYQPVTAGQIPGLGLSTARELRAVADQRLLIVMTYALAAGGTNRFDFYRWDTDCTGAAKVGTYNFGARPPHEFYLWHLGTRTLLFTTMFGAGNPALQVIDASDPVHPSLSGGWDAPVGELHSISLSADGTRAYLALWRGGLLVADAADFTSFRPNPTLRLITPSASAIPAPPGGNVHSAVQIPGRNLVVLTDERYQPACPYGPARLIDISDAAKPRLVSVMSAPENSAAVCAQSARNTYTSHNPTLTPDLALITWYASGIQIFDTADPANPVRLAEFRAQGQLPGAIDSQLGGLPTTMTWSYPIIRDGLIYVADINQGLFVLRYQGPHQAEVEGLAFSEGNSNLTANLPVPTPPTAAAVSPASSPVVAAGRAAQGPRAAGISFWPVIVAAVGFLLVGLGGLLFLRRARTGC